MSLEVILAQLLTMTEAVPNVGRIYDYSRFHALPAVAQQEFGVEDHASPRQWSIRTGWWFRRGSPVPPGHADLADEVTMVAHNIVFQYYLEINDAVASEKLCRDIVDNIRALFKHTDALQDVAFSFTFPSIPEGLETEALFADTFACHDTEMHMTVYELEDRGPAFPA